MKPRAVYAFRSGFVMVAVLVIVAAAILVATGAIFAARAALSSSRASDFERRLRDAALDGVALAADAVARDRDRILAGGAPSCDELLAEIPDGDRRIEVRLVPQPGGESFASESAKLDANTASPESLAKVVDASSELARQIVAAMSARRPLTSVDAAVALAPVAKADEALREVLGPLRATGEERESADEARGPADRDAAPPLVAVLTVLGAEPLVDDAGRPRLDLVAAFGDGAAAGESTASLAEFEDAEREALSEVARKAKPDDDDGVIARALIARGVDLARVDRILAGCTVQAGSHGKPRVDIVRANQRVLAAIDGIGPDAATRIVDIRDSLDQDERQGTGWLVSRRILTPEQYGAVAGRVTGRSTLWRFRVEARIVSDQEDDERRSTAADADPRATAAFDCVVDVSSEPKRIAFLRDVTMLPTARVLAYRARAAQDNAEGGEDLPKTRPSDRSDSADADGDQLADEPSDAVGTDDVRIDPPEPSRFDAPRLTAPATAPERAPRGRTSPTGRDIGGSR